MEASFIRSKAELQPGRRLLPLSRQSLELFPRGGVETGTIVQQNAFQQRPNRRPRLQRRVQTTELALASAVRTGYHDKRWPPPQAQPKSDRAAERNGGGGGRSWETGIGVGKATVHSTNNFGGAD